MTTEAKLVSQELPQLYNRSPSQGLLLQSLDPSFAFPVPTPLLECFRTQAVSCQPVSERSYEGKLPRVTIGAKDIVSDELGRSVTEWDMAQCSEELTTDEVYPSLSAQ